MLRKNSFLLLFSSATYRRQFMRRAIRIFVSSILLVVLILATLWVIFPFDKTPLYSIPVGATWQDSAGIPIRISLAKDGSDSIPTYEYYEEDWIAKAIVAAEDHRFWQHHGVDPLAILRASQQGVTSMRRISGASTISMQLIRMSQPHPRTLTYKMLEAFRALQMEQQLSKKEIISLYLNRAPFGSNVIGIEAAARRYFSKGAHDLTLAEASMLAGIPQSPTRLHPIRHSIAAKKRQNYVLEKMLTAKMIHTEQKDNALAQPLSFQPKRYPFHAPHFCDLATRQPVSDGKEIITTLDLDLQRIIEDDIDQHMPAFNEQGIHGAAVVVIDVKTGGIRALLGSPNFHAPTKGAQVNSALARRSAGSTLKPFVYAMALENGSHTPQTMLYDVPTHFRDYDPVNFDKGYRGIVSLRDSLIHSLNLPAIEVERVVGQPAYYAQLQKLGFSTLTRPASEYGLGLVLGNAEITLLDLTNAYACLARGGVYLPAQTTQNTASNISPPRVFSPEACWLISDILSGDDRALDSTGTIGDIRHARFAWKTGTSTGFRDAWTCAYNPDYAIGIWLGNPNGRSSPALVGRKVAAPLVWHITRRLYPDGVGPWFTKPSDIESRELCGISGKTPCPNCTQIIHGHAIRGVSRYESCEIHRFSRETQWPPHVAEFLRHRGQNPIPANANSDSTTSIPTTNTITITSPAAGSTYLFIKDASPRGAQRIPLTASAHDSTAKLHWFINDAYLGSTQSGSTLFWDLRPGKFHIVCSDASGSSRSTNIMVNQPRSLPNTEP